MLIITLLLMLKPYFSNVFRDTTEDHFVDNFKSYVDETVSEFKKKAMSLDEEFNIPASLVKKSYVLTYLTIKRVGWTVYSTNTLNMVARISSFAWHASVVMAPIWHMALHNTNLYGTLVRSYSLGCCSQSSVEASGLNLFMYKLFGLVHICCHLGLYTLGHLGLYIFVAIWACTVWAIWACTYLLPFGPMHGRQITIIM